MKSHDLEKVLKLCELYWGLLSLNITLGMECFPNILIMWVMTGFDEVFGSWASLEHLPV